MLFRDDDISVHTPLDEFERVHSLFIQAGKLHTIGILAKDIWRNCSLWNYLLTAPYLEWALHGWQHERHERVEDVKAALALLNSRVTPGANGVRTCLACTPQPVIPVRYFFPPFNDLSVELGAFCSRNNLIVDSTFGESPQCFAFHYWEVNLYPVVHSQLCQLLGVYNAA